ncbi:hypothetical protein IB234_08570 [Pseudomonas sp. PDM16]|uniref:DUF6279 family lipoprotein n=1 Tax=Pseudomonas sp. PDM16 TaxID=2769292 RepID=UPI001780CAA0|nr:DUF6279 family lipoprotein [Pseudomonas sp. PDM16]MBD9414616.1 hypothetical protein [Pseudomonas sp. PDM16]
MRRRFSPLPLLVLLAGLTLLTACSRLDLAYRNLDWLLTWRIDSYLDLNSEQKAWLKPRLNQHLAWHCSTQLPQLASWLDQDRANLAAGQLDAPHLKARFLDLRDALGEVSAEISPTAAGLLQQLSPLQVQQLRQSMAKENEKLRREFVEPPLAEQISKRSETTEERLEPWFGILDAQQKALVRSWAEQRGEQNRLWLDSRERWQAALLQELDARRSADFPQRIEALLRERQDYWSEDYRRSFTDGERSLAELLDQLIATSSPAQRQQLSERLDALREDIAKLTCTSPAAEAVASRSE